MGAGRAEAAAHAMGYLDLQHGLAECVHDGVRPVREGFVGWEPQHNVQALRHGKSYLRSSALSPVQSASSRLERATAAHIRSRLSSSLRHGVRDG